MEIGCHFGALRAQNAIMSATMRMLGRGGEIHSFCAMNSFRMSVWMVPPTLSSGTPCSSASAKYIDSATMAGALMVMDVVTRSSGMPAKRRRMSSRLATDTPSRPTSPAASG